MKLTAVLRLLAAAVLTTTAARAELLSYYVGLDDLPTIATGTYAGLPNPNFNHLTLLFAHHYPVGGIPNGPSSNHYHSKGTLIYTGPNLGASTAVIRSPSDYVPEGTIAPIKLSLGTGIYAGKLVSNPYTDPQDPSYAFSFLEIGSTQSLAGFGPTDGESYLFNSSGGRWDSAYPLAHLHFELISLSPGLNWGDASATDIGFNSLGNEMHITDPGPENNSFGATPVLWAEASATPGIYEAKFRVFDDSGAYGNSGEIRIRTEVVAVPEPTTAAALLGGMAVLVARRRRRAW